MRIALFILIGGLSPVSWRAAPLPKEKDAREKDEERKRRDDAPKSTNTPSARSRCSTRPTTLSRPACRGSVLSASIEYSTVSWQSERPTATRRCPLHLICPSQRCLLSGHA